MMSISLSLLTLKPKHLDAHICFCQNSVRITESGAVLLGSWRWSCPVVVFPLPLVSHKLQYRLSGAASGLLNACFLELASQIRQEL